MRRKAAPPSLSPEAYAVIEARHYDPFRYLGPHVENGAGVVRVFLPGASEVSALSTKGEASSLAPVHESGLFIGPLPGEDTRYKLRARFGENVVTLDDAYRFPPVLSETDLYLLAEGTDMRLYDRLGAHPLVHDGVPGVAFAVFAPNARRVSVAGDFNVWDGRRHAMRVRGQGFWEIFVPGAAAGDKYKFEIAGPDGCLLPLKSDPFAFAAELRPSTASVVAAEAAVPRPHPAPPGINRRDADRKSTRLNSSHT